MNGAKWKQVQLGQCCEVFSGFPFKSDGFTDNDDDVHLVKGENIGQGQVLWDISKRWPREDATALERYRLVPGDVVLAMDRPWVPAGLKFARIPESAPDAWLVQRAARLRANEMMTQPFLACLVGSPDFTAYIQNVGRGVGVPHISGRQIGAYPVNLPPLKDQERIADTLSAYDDLMENNRRRMALLEESARLLYREWFVHLRFPGHEHTRLIEGVPQGWRKFTLAETCAFLKRGVAPHYNDEAEGLVISQKCIRGGRVDMNLARRQSREFKADRQVQCGDVLVNSTGEGTLGRVAQLKIAIQNCTVDTHVTIVRPQPGVPPHYFGLALMDWEPRFMRMGKGSTNQTELSPDDIGRTEIVMPAGNLIERFEAVAEPAYNQVTNLTEQNQKLRTARDLLLPRLMSGEIEV